MLYVTTNVTQVSGNPDKTIPAGTAIDVVQESPETLTLSSGDWVNTSDAMPFSEDVNADGSGVGSAIGNKEGFKTTLVYGGIALAVVFYFIWKQKNK